MIDQGIYQILTSIILIVFNFSKTFCIDTIKQHENNKEKLISKAPLFEDFLGSSF